MIESEMKPEDIADACMKRFRLEVEFYKLPPSELRKMYLLIAMTAYYNKHKNHNHIIEGEIYGPERIDQ